VAGRWDATWAWGRTGASLGGVGGEWRGPGDGGEGAPAGGTTGLRRLDWPAVPFGWFEGETAEPTVPELRPWLCPRYQIWNRSGVAISVTWLHQYLSANTSCWHSPCSLPATHSVLDTSKKNHSRKGRCNVNRARACWAMSIILGSALAPASHGISYGDCENLGFCEAQFDRCWANSYSQFSSCVLGCPPLGYVGFAICVGGCEIQWGVRNAGCLNQLLTCEECNDRPELTRPTDCPVIIDLDRNNFHLTGIEEGVLFDINADGQLDAIAWTRPDHQDAFLCFDRNGNGLIDDGTELFGNSTPLSLSAGFTAPNGYVALAEFDMPSLGGNPDGFIDVSDAIYEDLCVWTDSNHNGTSEPEEISSLMAAGVERVGLSHQSSARTDQYGNEFRYRGEAWIRARGASKHTHTVDVFFVSPRN
jgi:hypothetical protein